MSRTALIAGGGIGGMAAALALARGGWQVRLCEQAEAIAEAGAGLQVTPNAVRALDWMGVGDAVRRVAMRPEAASMLDGLSGRTIYRVALGQAAERRWGAPYLHLHRADLLDVLLDAARAAGAAVETGVRVTGYVLRPDGVRLTREASGGSAPPPVEASGGGGLPPLEAAVAIGADGIRSALRARLNGPGAAGFTGQVAWRALVPAARLDPRLAAPEVRVFAGPGRHLVSYPLRGGSVVNLVAVEEQAEWAEEGWSVPGDPDRLRAGFAGWHADVGALLAEVDIAYVWGLFVRPEQVRWTDGCMALLGDAAHPMLPFMAQGASQALEDAVALARSLSAAGAAGMAAGVAGVGEALARYEAQRWPRAARVQAQSRANGRLFHLGGPARLLAQGPLALVSRAAPGFAASRLDWLYGHDVTA